MRIAITDAGLSKSELLYARRAVDRLVNGI
jgi:hypothetical protein